MVKQPEKSKNLTGAVLEVANAIQKLEKRKASQRRIELGTNLMALGNISVGALLFGQAFSGFPFDLRTAILGVVVLVLAYVWAISVMRGGDR